MLLLLRERFEPRANWSASYCARPLVFRTVLICEVRSFGEKCRLQRQITVSSAISSTVIQLEGLSLLGILRPVDRVRWQTALPDGGESVLSTPLKIRILGIEKRNLRSRLRGCRLPWATKTISDPQASAGVSPPASAIRMGRVALRRLVLERAAVPMWIAPYTTPGRPLVSPGIAGSRVPVDGRHHRARPRCFAGYCPYLSPCVLI